MPFDAEAWLVDFPPPPISGSTVVATGFAGEATQEKREHQGGTATAAIAPVAPPLAGSPSPTGQQWDAERRASAYLAKMDPAVSGQHGHSALFAAAMIGPGFGLSPESTFKLLWTEYNVAGRCDPLWDEHDVRRKVDEAFKKEGHRAGWLAAVGHDGTATAPADTAYGGNGHHAGNGYAPPGANGIVPPVPPSLVGSLIPLDERPTIIVNPDEDQVVRNTIATLGNHPDVFVRSGKLFEITYTWDNVDSAKMIDVPKMEMIDVDKLRTMITASAKLVTNVWNAKEEEFEERQCHVPPWLAKGIFARKIYPGIRPIETVTETPVMRPDGGIVKEPGYDHATRIYYRPNCDYGDFLENPTHEDAKQAANRILSLVDEFPFVMDCHRGAWLSNVLSVIGRFMFNGPCPVFIYDAAQSQSGKTMLCDLVSVITTGYIQSRAPAPDNQEEFRKNVTSTLLSGIRVVLMDNIPVGIAFGGHVMDALLTGEVWNDRLMMTMKIVELKINTVFMVTGNNMSIKGDLANRLIHCRIRPDTPNPEARTFKIKDIVNYCQENRISYLKDALTILRAYHLAGRPCVTDSKIGRFVAWSDLIRSAVVWALGADFDPALSQKAFKAEDEAASQKHALIHGLQLIPEAMGPKGVTATQILKYIDGDTSGYYEVLTDALKEWGNNRGELPGSKLLGTKLRTIRHEVIGDYYLTSQKDRSRVAHWRLMSANAPIPPSNMDEATQDEESNGFPAAYANGTGWAHAHAIPHPDIDRHDSTPF